MYSRVCHRPNHTNSSAALRAKIHAIQPGRKVAIDSSGGVSANQVSAVIPNQSAFIGHR